MQFVVNTFTEIIKSVVNVEWKYENTKNFCK